MDRTRKEGNAVRVREVWILSGRQTPWESFGGRACGMWSFHCLVYSPVGLEGGGDDEILLLS